ncbi:MAG: DUF393 domain-containing protein [Rhizobacter sp.]|nr:DUF393 domain-containing protein [Ferruginibacter sp.]
MKTLIYDKECPLCVAYTGAFVKTGLLEKEGRKHFNETAPELLEKLDKARCHNEIPLIDNSTGKVWYGIDALLEILSAKMPWIKKAGNFAPLHWLLKKLYKLVSYNRKVIVATKSIRYDCSPDFSSRYRILFLITGLLLNSWLFTLCIPVFKKGIFSTAGFEAMQIAHFSFVAINIGIAILLGKQKGLEYLGQVNMLAMLTMLLLLPLQVFQNIIGAGSINCSFGMIGFFIAREYIRRMTYAGIVQNNKLVVAINMLCVGSFLFFLAS